VLLSVLQFYRDILSVTILYDIACQFHKNFFTRISRNTFPQRLSGDVDLATKKVRFFIDKFHEEVHGCAFKDEQSLHTTPEVGRTHGSTQEQEWSHSNKCAPATREMGQGARHHTLDDHWHGWNHLQLVMTGMSGPFVCCLILIFLKVFDFVINSKKHSSSPSTLLRRLQTSRQAILHIWSPNGRCRKRFITPIRRNMPRITCTASQSDVSEASHEYEHSLTFHFSHDRIQCSC
jgi:hypothetical protein